MATFTVPIKRISSIESHPGADALEFVVIDGFRSIVRKNIFHEGDLVVYIREASVVPEWLMKKLGLWDEINGRGRLVGVGFNRVKAIMLRGELSQGICLSVSMNADGQSCLVTNEEGNSISAFEGDDVSGFLGISKWVPEIPDELLGEVFVVDQMLTVGFDVEDIKSFPHVFEDGEEVVFTEKLHGTCTILGNVPIVDAHDDAFGKDHTLFLFSKGFGAHGVAFKDVELNRENVYVESTFELMRFFDEKIECIRERFSIGDEPVFLIGETTGKNVQDLVYDGRIVFRLFAVVVGYRNNQRYLDHDDMREVARILGVGVVPVLYRGPFSQAFLVEYTSGRSMVGNHIREGVVVTPVVERVVPYLGRVCLKSVSPAYLVRKGGTEYN